MGRRYKGFTLVKSGKAGKPKAYLTGFTLIKSGKAGKPEAYLTGFTLIEILIVVAIIAILATVVIINVSGAKAKSRYAKVVSDMTAISKAVDLYQIENYNVYPGDGSVGTLPTYIGGVDTGQNVLLNYLTTWPATPCGSDYAYEYQNWSATAGSNYAGTGYAGVHFVHNVSHTPSSDRWVYYYDIHNFALVTAEKGDDIKTVSTITCKE